jgi:diketogulonate reductase-like aldo/keto reductase
MESLLATGKVRAIGVANYSVPFLNELLPEVSVIPAVNQIENHPLLPQQEIVDFCAKMRIHVTAYSPLGSSGSPLLELLEVRRIAKGKKVPPSAVLLSWHGISTPKLLFAS